MTILRDELLNDPKGKGYTAHLPGDPEKVAELLRAPTESMVKAIQSTTAQAWAATGPYANIVDASAKKDGQADHPCRASCLVLRDAFASGVPIHMERPDVQGMFSAWVTTGICTQAQADDLYQRSTQPASRAEVLGIPAPTARDILDALKA